MEITRREIKNRAIIGLKDGFLRSVLTCFLAIFYYFLLKIITFYLEKNLPTEAFLVKSLFSFGSVLVFSILPGTVLFSAFSWHYNKLCGRKSPEKPSFLRVSRLNTLLSLRLLFYGFLFLSPAFILHFSTLAIKLSARFQPAETVLLSLDLLTVILALLCGLFLFFFMTRYLLCWAILSEDSSVSARSTIKMSVRMMKGEKVSALCFMLSLAPFFLCSLLIIPAFYYLPKAVSSICLYEKYIIEKNRMSFPMLSYK